MLLEHRVEERGAPGPDLVFLHGWPDGPHLWDGLSQRLTVGGRRVFFTLPAFADSAATHGADLPELVARLHASLDAIGCERVVLVAHDWGAVLGYLYEAAHPERVDRVVAFDVGGHFAPRTPRDALYVVAYQWWLIAAFFVGKLLPPLGDAMTRWMARQARAPRPDQARSRANYLYYWVWLSMLLPGRRPALSRYRPTRPVLFLYGERKLFMLHSLRWERALPERGDGSKVVPVAKAGHWLMLDKPDEVAGVVEAWLGAVGR